MYLLAMRILKRINRALALFVTLLFRSSVGGRRTLTIAYSLHFSLGVSIELRQHPPNLQQLPQDSILALVFHRH